MLNVKATKCETVFYCYFSIESNGRLFIFSGSAMISGLRGIQRKNTGVKFMLLIRGKYTIKEAKLLPTLIQFSTILLPTQTLKKSPPS